MRRSLLLSIIIALCMPMFGNPVDETTAKQLAQNFWKENNIMGVKGDKVFKKKMGDARFVNVAPQCGYNEFYIFNNEDGKGFVIIAADDCVTPILGYSYDNNFAVENLPPNLKGWLDGYAEQIRMAIEMRASATEEIRTDWDCLRQGRNLPIRSETAVSPLITTTWGQGEYYNAQCPSLLGFHTPTGCVATAMAQIMKYWNYPSHGYNYHSYECWPYGEQSANFGGTNYQWSYMPNNVTSSNNAVATLMYHCGVSVEMNYGIIHGSGAQIISYDGQFEYCAENALKTFFGYSQNISGIERRNNENNWTNIIKNELNNSRPILYGGSGTGGHAFVCDGYNNTNFFHFNWGWGGESNDFYTLNNLNPMNGGELMDFNQYQHALIGIQPDSNLQNFDLVLYDEVQMVGDNNGNYDFGQSIASYAEILNNGNSTFSGYIAAAVFDDDYYFIDFLGGGYSTIEPNYWVGGTVEHIGGIPFLPSYDYLYHTVMFYSTDGQHWTMVTPGNYNNNGVFQVQYFGEDIETNSEMLFSNGEENVFFNGQSITINVDVVNNSNSAYNKTIWIALLDSNEDYVQIIDDVPVNIPANSTISLDFSDVITAPEGQYYLALFYSDPDDYSRYVGSVFYPSIKRVYIINSPYTISATANPNNGGTITGQGEYNEGETCTLIATTNNGYSFVNWTENGTQVSTNAIYTFMVTGDRNLVANFQVQPSQQYTVNVLANPSNGGTVSGGGTYLQGQTCTISATPNTGFSFYQWNDGVTTNPRTITVTQDTTFVAFFHDNNNQGSGGFSVSASKKVIISQGNLQYQASTGTWRFAEHQYDVIGEANSSISSNYDGWIDLFGWGTSGYNHGAVCYQPWSTSLTNYNYYAYGAATYNLFDQTGQADWGYNAISNGGNEINQWRTLTNEEWYYIFNTRNASTVNGVSNARYAKAQVENIHGVIIFPDNYSHPSNVTQPTGINETGNAGWNGNVYTDDEWNSMEANGAIFLPVTGYRDGTTVYDFGAYGNYWSASVYQNNVYTMNFHDTYISQGGMSGSYRYHGIGVRLVQNYQEYSILGQAMPAEGGVISGSGLYGSGSECTLTATANPGYNFVNWIEGGTQVSTSPNYTFIVTCNRNLVANFQAQQQQYVISVSANPSNGGNVTGGGSFNPGASCTVQATANSGYVFVNWTENGAQVSTNANYTFAVTSNRNLVANFEVQLPEYSVSVSSNPNDGGNVTGGGIYTQGQSCTVSATANDGYTFVNWTENGIQVSSNANYTFVVTSNMALVANFQIQSYTISVAANPSNGGTATGGGTYEYGQICSVTANSGNGFNFVNWTENGVQVSTYSNYTFTVTGNRNLVANFTSQSYVITATADPSAGGVITGSGGYNYGETCTLTASANTGYTFVNWTKNGTQVSTNTTYSFTVTESATYVAHFNIQSYSITVAAYPNNAGSVTGGGSYNYGQTCTVHATANSGYTFTNWTENGTQVSTNANYSFTVTGNRNLVANFAQNTHTIHATAGVNGTVTPSGNITVAHGANQSFAMIPDSDYEVQEVYIDGNPIGAMTSYTFTNVTADHYIHVTFLHVDGVGEDNTPLINLYPNPTSGEITLEGENLSHVRIVNTYGQTVYNAKVEGEQVRIDLSNMAKGIYMMHIEAEGRQAVRKIVVE